jgi:hypothetical protein
MERGVLAISPFSIFHPLLHPGAFSFFPLTRSEQRVKMTVSGEISHAHDFSC